MSEIQGGDPPPKQLFWRPCFSPQMDSFCDRVLRNLRGALTACTKIGQVPKRPRDTDSQITKEPGRLGRGLFAFSKHVRAGCRVFHHIGQHPSHHRCVCWPGGWSCDQQCDLPTDWIALGHHAGCHVYRDRWSPSVLLIDVRWHPPSRQCIILDTMLIAMSAVMCP